MILTEYEERTSAKILVFLVTSFLLLLLERVVHLLYVERWTKKKVTFLHFVLGCAFLLSSLVAICVRWKTFLILPHIGITGVIISSSLFLKEKKDLLFISLCCFVILLTRWWFGHCLMTEASTPEDYVKGDTLYRRAVDLLYALPALVASLRAKASD